MMNNRLFVGSLSFDTTENTLQDLFAQAGKVISVNVIQDKFSGKSRGFAFVEMATPEEAAKAIEMFNGKDVDGRAIAVNEARPKEDRPRSGGGFGGGGGGGGGGRRDRDRGGERRNRY